ncbi:hypothetical protein E8E12_000110 [Didymella heteroderae]|uniref:Bacteriophage T5 Orf172 DNA-binding domain-containing protein n=1 Tax=Didymella heteroderae TaxID=1769908 RepID=A0A9P4WJE3_9PLEO|nr:hypothetical protein E8E12_000110 [Didymella heteroderae]
MKMVSHCIKLFKYMALPDHIEELVKNKTCGIHRKVAIEQPMAESRLDTLRALVILIPDLTESDTATLSTWLQAISGIETSPLLNRIVPFCMHVKLSQKPNRCVRLDCKELPLKSGKNDESRQSMIDKLVKQSAHSHQELACTYLAIVKAWIEAFTKCNLPTTFGTGSESSMKITKAALQPKVVDAPTDTAIILPASSFKFAPYQTEPSSIRSIAEALFAKASKALSAWDRKDGYIYMFWDQQHFGMVKVGRTADREQRLKQWNSQCKITHHYHRILKDTSSSRIPHVQRIEKLLHIELGNYRKKRTCDGCGRTHIEWFDISAEKARQVYQKWEDWIVQRPYAQDKAGNWVIRPEMLGSLSEVCKPVVFSEPIKSLVSGSEAEWSVRVVVEQRRLVRIQGREEDEE